MTKLEEAQFAVIRTADEVRKLLSEIKVGGKSIEEISRKNIGPDISFCYDMDVPD